MGGERVPASFIGVLGAIIRLTGGTGLASNTIPHLGDKGKAEIGRALWRQRLPAFRSHIVSGHCPQKENPGSRLLPGIFIRILSCPR